MRVKGKKKENVFEMTEKIYGKEIKESKRETKIQKEVKKGGTRKP